MFFRSGTGLPLIYPPPQHINVVPETPEELHESSHGLVSRMLLHDANRLANPGDLLNRVVYDCLDKSPMNNESWALGPTANDNGDQLVYSKKLRPYYTPLGPEDTTLVFESRFESGNLRRAIQVLVIPCYSHLLMHILLIGTSKLRV